MRPRSGSSPQAGPSTRPRGSPRRWPRWRRAAAGRWRWTSPTRRSMQAAVAAVEGEHGAVGALVNNAGYSQSGAIETVPMEKVRGAVRDECVRTRAPVPARAARDAAAARRPHREPLLDGREARLPRRRLLPRDQVRGGGDLRRAALRGQGLRDRRRAGRAGADPYRVRHDRGGRRERGRRGRGRLRALQRPRGDRDRADLRVRRPDRAARRPARGGRQGDREGAHREPPARPLHRHALGQAADGAARAAARPRRGTPSCDRSSPPPADERRRAGGRPGAARGPPRHRYRVHAGGPLQAAAVPRADHRRRRDRRARPAGGLRPRAAGRGARRQRQCRSCSTPAARTSRSSAASGGPT